ncbi:MAG: hypothetical protein OXC62_15355 [Aestuariivita sp.]|nr:hypothetical protein [Aestuariivita sp.]
MAFIYVSNKIKEGTFFAGRTLSDAARRATEARIGYISADSVIPIGGTHQYIVYRDVDPELFWFAQLAHTMQDNENFGWGNTKAQACGFFQNPEIAA